MFDQFKLKGYLTLLKFDKNGLCVDETRLSNLIVDQGLEFTSKLLNGVSTDAFKYVAIGSNDTAAAVSDTALNTEEEIMLATATYEADFKSKLTAIFTFTGTVTIKEAGIFDAASSGSLLSRVVFADKTFEDGESLGVIWTIEMSRS